MPRRRSEASSEGAMQVDWYFIHGTTGDAMVDRFMTTLRKLGEDDTQIKEKTLSFLDELYANKGSKQFSEEFITKHSVFTGAMTFREIVASQKIRQMLLNYPLRGTDCVGWPRKGSPQGEDRES